MDNYRGYVQQLGTSQKNPSILSLLDFVGNDGGIDQGKLADYSPTAQRDYGNLNNQLFSQFNNQKGKVLGASTTAAPANTNASDLAYLDDYDNSLRTQLGSAHTALDQGLTQIGDTYNQNATRTNQDKNTADTGYNDSRTSTTKDKLKAVDTVNTGARTLANSVRQVLGLAGGSNSSAYKFAAPQAIARDTTIKRTGVNDTYAKNYKSIDDSQTATDLKFSRALEDLTNQKKQKESDLRSGVLQQEQGIQSELGKNALTRAQIGGAGYAGTRAALAPFTAAVSDRQSKIDALFSQFRTPYSLQDTTPVAANVDAYQTPGTDLNLNSGGPAPAGGDASLSPYLRALQKKFQPAVA